VSVFNSLGSNYSKHFILDSFGFGTKNDTLRLKQKLHETYKAETIQLTFKGREAITLILKQLNLPTGSLVAVNGFTCYAVYEAITAAELKPFYLDIEKNDLNFKPDTLQDALKNNKNIKAVMVQNTLGMIADVPTINRICKQHGAVLIEDLAHSIGLLYSGGTLAGTVADYSALSFSQDKVIDAVSGGAMVFKNVTENSPTSWDKVSLKVRLRGRLYPISTWVIRKTIRFWLGRFLLKFMKSSHLLSRPMSGEAGTPHTLPSWYSGLAVKAFNNLDNVVDHRQKIAAIYRQALPKENCLKHHDNNIYLRFPLLVDNRKELINYLKRWHIYITDIWYDAPIGPKKSMEQTDYKKGSCPNSEEISEKIVNLPTHINVNETQATLIAEKVSEWLKSQ
jgi:dTDP-4-amino-4,6-dideoxygalactose transaminase